MRKIIFLIAIFASFSLFAAPPAFAADSPKFSVTFDLTYKVRDDGRTTVTQNFHLTNLSTEFYSSEYTAQIGTMAITSLRAYDRTGILPVTISQTPNGQEIHTKFGDQVVGVGNSLNWTMAYDTTDIARKSGRLWEIYIPKPIDPGYVTDYTIGLYVPDSFGKRIFVQPQPKTDNNVWSKQDISTIGIAVTYDPQEETEVYQNYDFKLLYNLYNSRLYPVQTKIALPPDTNYQKVFLNSLDPKPVNVALDVDGNWLATYNLNPAGRLDVTAIGSAIVYSQPKFTTMPENDLSIYLGRENTSTPQLKTIDQINDYVVAAKYSTTRTGSLGFTDEFISLAQATGIPAREVDGYSIFPTKSYLLQSWPEYFDNSQNTWKMVDPTWQNLTHGFDYLHNWDTNHIVFAIRGQNTDAPIIAGHQEMSFHDGNLDANQAPHLGFRVIISNRMTSGFPANGQVILENYGPTAFSGDQIIFSAGQLPIQPERYPISSMPPFSSQTINFSLPGSALFDEKSDIITIEFAGQKRDYPISIKPFYKNNFLLVVGGLTTLGLISLIAQIARSLFIQKQRKYASIKS